MSFFRYLASRSLAVALFVTGSSPMAWAAGPEVRCLLPAGGQRGTSVEITTSGNFPKWPVQAWVDRPGVTLTAAGEKGKLSASISADATPGLYWIRVCDAYGASAPQPFIVGTLAEVAEQEPNDNPQKILRAIDIHTGKIKWELPQKGRAESWGGTLATSTGLVFFCEDSGAFMAVDATTGKPLWNFQLNANWKASPITYKFDNTQYFAVAAGSDIVAFALPEK